jgi:hypothetical protein
MSRRLAQRRTPAGLKTSHSPQLKAFGMRVICASAQSAQAGTLGALLALG